MTKTFDIVGSQSFANPGQAVILPLDTTAQRSVLNFEFWSLGFIWDLVFDAWNFCDVDYEEFFSKSYQFPVSMTWPVGLHKRLDTQPAFCHKFCLDRFFSRQSAGESPFLLSHHTFHTLNKGGYHGPG
jgi:hypothetical protein